MCHMNAMQEVPVFARQEPVKRMLWMLSHEFLVLFDHATQSLERRLFVPFLAHLGSGRVGKPRIHLTRLLQFEEIGLSDGTTHGQRLHPAEIVHAGLQIIRQVRQYLIIGPQTGCVHRLETFYSGKLL